MKKKITSILDISGESTIYNVSPTTFPVLSHQKLAFEDWELMKTTKSEVLFRHMHGGQRPSDWNTVPVCMVCKDPVKYLTSEEEEKALFLFQMKEKLE